MGSAFDRRPRCTFGGIEFYSKDIASSLVPQKEGSHLVQTRIVASSVSKPTIECLHDAMRREVRLPLTVETIGTMRSRIVEFEMGGGPDITVTFEEDNTPNPPKAQSPDPVELWDLGQWGTTSGEIESPRGQA